MDTLVYPRHQTTTETFIRANQLIRTHQWKGTYGWIRAEKSRHRSLQFGRNRIYIFDFTSEMSLYRLVTYARFFEFLQVRCRGPLVHHHGSSSHIVAGSRFVETGNSEGVPRQVLERNRLALAQEFGTIVWPSSAVGLFGDHWVHYSHRPRTLGRKCHNGVKNTASLGMLHQIKPCDIFPRLSEEEFARMVMNFAPAVPEPPKFINYFSYDDEKEAADGQIQEELHVDILEIATDRATLEEKLGPLVPSRIGVLIKTKGKKRKVRLIHDLSRGGVNQTVIISERVVLPRASDVFESVHALAHTCQGNRVLTFLSLDFKDAFKHLRISEDERRFCSGWSSLG